MTTSLPTVIALLAQRLEIPADSIKPQTELEALGADSLAVIELIFDLEESFKIELGDERPNLVVVQDIADHIDAYLAKLHKPLKPTT
ncbi:MAG: acyl carrier protein [Burkholderiaceae bacterium]|nr:acyl carrier protein [Burkholderiaceae bacterium]